MKSDFAKLDRWLLFWTIFMFVLGIFMIFSASSVKASLGGAPYYYFVKQTITFSICAIVSYVIMSIPLRFYNKMAFIVVIGVVGSLVVVYLYGAIINQARSWIPLGFYNFQPSEFAKAAIVLYMAVYYNKYKDSKKLIVILFPLLAAITMGALTFIQPDFGTTVIIVALGIIIFFAVPFDKTIK
ncbi:MAG: FtsW/RodA/SpoVE family cell cycle protein, partial [Bacilli bacterium]|nr:FtsW/RodA/SpoVE family cell cycle protein [Bacilli bacterium]